MLGMFKRNGGVGKLNLKKIYKDHGTWQSILSVYVYVFSSCFYLHFYNFGDFLRREVTTFCNMCKNTVMTVP